MATDGTVREWHDDEGWGVIDSDVTPGGCWAHFSSVLTSGYRSLGPGWPVTFAFESGRQDGYDFRAVAVWTGDVRPEAPDGQSRSVAYTSDLHIEYDAPTESRPERWIAVLALALGPLSACTADPGPAPSPRPADSATADAASPPPSTLPTLAPSDSGRTLAHLENRTGPWKANLGTANDTGSLFITVACVGGGKFVVTHRGSTSGEGAGTPTCDGGTTADLDKAVPKGSVTVSVEPDGDQRWSVLIVRAPDVD